MDMNAINAVLIRLRTKVLLCAEWRPVQSSLSLLMSSATSTHLAIPNMASLVWQS